MAEKVSKSPEGMFELPIDWYGATEGVAVQHSNQVLVQIHEKEMILSFFYYSPPVLMGNAQQVKTQLDSITALKPECLGRISLPTDTFKSLAEILAKKVQEFNAESAEDNPNE